MEKYIYNEQNGLWYELQGDYYLPCLKLPEEGEVHIGIWGQRHRRYLKNDHSVRYINLLTSGKLNDYLSDLNEQAEAMFSRLVKQLSEKEGVTEGLKAENQLEPNHFFSLGRCQFSWFYFLLHLGLLGWSSLS